MLLARRREHQNMAVSKVPPLLHAYCIVEAAMERDENQEWDDMTFYLQYLFFLHGQELIPI